VNGPDIIARTLGEVRPFGPSKQLFQYHSRSDHHSKLCCWAIAFDLLATSSLLRQHVTAGKVCIGVNHTMVDFKTSRKKDLDLVIARPAADARPEEKVVTLADLGESIGVVLTEAEQAEFAALPSVGRRSVGSVLVALEAKAAATEHKKSESRMFDELNSSQATVHGAADQAVAVGLAVVNIADTFLSPGRQKIGEPLVVNRHNQPVATESLIAKLRELPRRSSPGESGFDALGIMVIVLVNDGSPVTVHRDPPSPQPGDPDTYAAMVLRAASLYDYRFSTL
jgi:ribosomal protein L30E